MILQPNGRPATTQVDVPMSRTEAQMLADIAPVLNKYGLSLFCERCHRLGLPDGVQAMNDLTKREKVVACGCTVRKYVGELRVT